MSERLVTLGMIIGVVETAFDFPRRQILADRRDQEAARARYAVWWLAHKLTLHSLPEIGAVTNRNHTTVLAGLARAEELRAADPDFMAATDAMFAVLQLAERSGALRLAGGTDPLAAARRILRAPEREAVRVSTAEIIAMAQLVVALTEPTDPIEEIDHG